MNNLLYVSFDTVQGFLLKMNLSMHVSFDAARILRKVVMSQSPNE